jgi:hypothetical protein
VNLDWFEPIENYEELGLANCRFGKLEVAWFYKFFDG